MLDLEGHYTGLSEAITNHQIVPFLGANINWCGRRRTARNQLEGWQLGKIPPSNRELALFLNEVSDNAYMSNIRCPICDTDDIERLPEGCPVREKAYTKIDLQHVSQYLANLNTEGPDVLYGALKRLVNADYTPNLLHNFFARLTGVMRQKGYYPPYPLIVSTCFDRTLEKAFENAGEFYDLVSFVGDQQGGRFAHQPPGEDPHPIEDPNTYQKLSLRNCPVILKLYGGMGGRFRYYRGSLYRLPVPP